MDRLAVLLSLGILAAGCRAPETKKYELVGQILAIAPERHEVTIRHHDIVGFMPGMTMPFTVSDDELLEGKSPGDLVTATLEVGETSAHISTLTKTGHDTIEAPPVQSAPVLRAGDAVADAPFVDQTGAGRPLSSFRGHRVALTFVYTRCPVPEFCPLMNRHFASIQKTLKTRPDLADVRLVSVTLDPAFDTPRVLAAHARVYDADPAIWTFLTGDPIAVKKFGEQFGITNESDPEDPSQITHSLRTAVIGTDGRLLTNKPGNDWTPADLLADLTAAPAPGN
jgi:protein SCO1/2